MTDVIIIGGGVIGLLSAWRLAQAGLSVELFEKGQTGAESSAAALGVLSPQSDSAHPSAFLKIAQASLALYPALAEELRAQTGIDIELRDEGMLYAALDDEDVETLHTTALQQQTAGVAVKLLTAREAHELEPAFGADVRGALHFSATKQVNNVALCKALALAATQAGVQIHEGQTVTRVIRDGYGVTGVSVLHGVENEECKASWVVVAAGSWSGGIEGVNLPVRPMKGHALMLDSTAVPSLKISHILDSREGYIVPRRTGRILIGATVEDVGFDKHVSDEAIESLVKGALHLVPALKDAPVREQWAGLRPCSADGLPIIGPVPDCAGFIAATGHFRNGILLAPITAQLVTEWVTDQKPSVDVQPFAPDRFGAEVVNF